MESVDISPETTKANNDESFAPSPEQLQRWDTDIATMESMKRFAASSNTTFVLGDGYAVEAHCGGKVTRIHGDIDGKLYFGDQSAADLSQRVADVLQTEDTEWVLQEQKDAGKIEFRENASAKTFAERRRLELQLIDSTPDGRTQKKKLIDSQGGVHVFDVDDINLLAAIKIRIINDRLDMSEEEKTIHRRPLKQQDVEEVKRLMAQPDFDQLDTLRRLAGILATRKGLSETTASEAALAKLQRVTSLNL